MTFRNRAIISKSQTADKTDICECTRQPALQIGINRQSIVHPLSAVIQNGNQRRALSRLMNQQSFEGNILISFF